ncbi:MAG: hypothetical protein EOP87_15515 [Verrucomicrobiaceae bacterium]|nr:MAG: hypothetical protein EOP87_15515 [Verrucomicrobiaceae bacterium]
MNSSLEPVVVAVVASVACLNESQAVILEELADHLPNLTGREREEMLRISNRSLVQAVALKTLLAKEDATPG